MNNDININDYVIKNLKQASKNTLLKFIIPQQKKRRRKKKIVNNIEQKADHTQKTKNQLLELTKPSNNTNNLIPFKKVNIMELSNVNCFAKFFNNQDKDNKDQENKGNQKIIKHTGTKPISINKEVTIGINKDLKEEIIVNKEKQIIVNLLQSMISSDTYFINHLMPIKFSEVTKYNLTLVSILLKAIFSFYLNQEFYSFKTEMDKYYQLHLDANVDMDFEQKSTAICFDSVMKNISLLIWSKFLKDRQNFLFQTSFLVMENSSNDLSLLNDLILNIPTIDITDFNNKYKNLFKSIILVVFKMIADKYIDTLSTKNINMIFQNARFGLNYIFCPDIMRLNPKYQNDDFLNTIQLLFKCATEDMHAVELTNLINIYLTDLYKHIRSFHKFVIYDHPQSLICFTSIYLIDNANIINLFQQFCLILYGLYSFFLINVDQLCNIPEDQAIIKDKIIQYIYIYTVLPFTIFFLNRLQQMITDT